MAVSWAAMSLSQEGFGRVRKGKGMDAILYRAMGDVY
jgi:hypothetical protein